MDLLKEYSQHGEGIPFGEATPRAGNDSGGGQPGRILKCKGWETDPNAYTYFITQAAVWEKVCTVIGKPEWIEDEKFKIIDHYHEFPERFDKGYQTCPSMQFLTIIGADSKVYSCHDKAYTKLGLLGSIENQRFKDFWYSDKNRERMQAINPSTDCQHHCAEHKRNLLLHEYLAVDSEHMEFV